MKDSTSKSPSSEPQPPSQLIENLLSALQDPQDLKPPLLKKLYHLLVHLSLDPAMCNLRDGADSASCFIVTGRYRIKVSLEDICSLSDMLFKELLKRFKLFIFAFHVDSASHVLEEASSHLDLWPTVELLNLLLRCCMVLLNLIVTDHHRLLEDGKVLLSILGVICSLNTVQANKEAIISFEKFTRKYRCDDMDCTTSSSEEVVASLHFMEPVEPSLPYMCTLLEVIVDELLVHDKLRAYFKLIDSRSSTSEKLFMFHSSNGDTESVIELVCTHFCLSFSADQAFKDFFHRLYFMHQTDSRAPELSLNAASVLLHIPFIFSAPKILQAYLISLVSESITSMGLGSSGADVRQMNCYLSAFERSVDLYIRHMSCLQMKNYPSGDKHSLLKSNTYQGHCQPSFENSIKLDSRKKVDHVISKVDDSWISHNIFWRSKGDLGTSSIAYITASKQIFDISFRDEIVTVLSCIISKASSGDADYSTSDDLADASPQDICLLASILKLMSCSLFQTVWCLMQNGNLGCLKTLKDSSSCEAYDSIVRIISCFQQFSISLPIQESLKSTLEANPSQHKESKLMLLHFLGLLSLSFSTGLDFLVRGCLSIMMVLMNLLAFEEGNIDALKFDDTVNFMSPAACCNDPKEVMVERKSSLKVACKFQNVQKQYHLRSRRLSCSKFPVSSENEQEETSAKPSIRKDSSHSVLAVEETEESCNGEVYLKCICKQLPSDFQDLADYIECKKGKNYSSWFKDKLRLRRRKCEKLAVLGWKKRRKVLGKR